MLKMIGVSRESDPDKLDIIEILALTTSIQVIGALHILFNFPLLVSAKSYTARRGSIKSR